MMNMANEWYKQAQSPMSVATATTDLGIGSGVEDKWYNYMQSPMTLGTSTPDTDYGLGDISKIWDKMGGLAGMKQGLGVASDAYGLYSALAGPSKELFNAQMGMMGDQSALLKQQLASNKESMQNRRDFNSNWANASNGLAASAVS